jgi:hypothetical protein
MSKRNSFRALTSRYELPGGILFLLSLSKLSIPILTPIPPQMKIDMKVGRDNMLKIRDSKTNRLGSHRKVQMVISNKVDMKSSRHTSQTSMESKAH